MAAEHRRAVGFLLPPYEPSYWKDRYAAASGAERHIVHARMWAMEIAQVLHDVPLTASSLAWFVLWLLGLIRALDAALGANSDFLLNVISRSLLELEGQLETIVRPWHEGKARDDSMRHSAGRTGEVRKRLRAYCAWSLVNDLNLFEEMQHPKTLEGVLTPSRTASSFARLGRSGKHTRESSESWRISATPNSRWRERAEKRLRRMRDDADGIIRAFSLGDWTKRACDIQKRHQGRSISFMSLFSEEPGSRHEPVSIRKHLRQTDLGWGYGEFQRASMLLHQSSLLLVATTDGKRAHPRLVDMEDFHASAVEMASGIEMGLRLLELISRRILRIETA